MAARYGLLPVPPSLLAASPALAALHDDEAAWCRYAAARGEEDPEADGSDEGGDRSDRDPDDGGEDLDDEDGSRRLSRAVRAHLRAHLTKAGVAAPMEAALLRSMVQSYDAEWEEEDELRSLDAHTTLWSPLALPTGVGLHFTWHHRARADYVEYGLSLRYRPLPLPPPGAAATPASSPNWVPLLRSSFEDPPSTGYMQLDMETWADVEVSSSPGLTPATVRVFRRCLLGGDAAGALGEPASGWPSDYALTSFVVRAGMAECRFLGYTGHVWRPSAAAVAAIKADGVWGVVRAEERRGVARSWVDHATRVASGAAATADRYYQPYDAAAAKAAWGAAALEAADRMGAMDGMNSSEEEAWEALDPGTMWAAAAAGRFPRLPGLRRAPRGNEMPEDLLLRLLAERGAFL